MPQLPAVSVIVPAYNAQETIAKSLKSALAQTTGDLEILIVVDDGADYGPVLDRAGIDDPRIRMLDTGKVRSGSSNARNIGLDAARNPICAILDADDFFLPEKLAVMAKGAKEHGLASCALAVTLPDGQVLRHVGAGPDRDLTPQNYKFTNISMDSMLVYDRNRADPRYDPGLPCLTDLDLLLKLFATFPACRHFGTPLHAYVKMPVSVSNGPGVTERMVATKNLMLSRLDEGFYPLAAPHGISGIKAFLQRSLEAEKTYRPDKNAAIALFEDHLETVLEPTGMDFP